MNFPNPVTYHVFSRCLPLNDFQGYQYILAGNGVFLRAENRFVSALVPIARCHVRGLAPLQGHVKLKVPRLPERLLATALADTRRTRAPDGHSVEALYHFHHTGRLAYVVKPRQAASAVRVSSLGGGDPDILLDLHSHGNMPAFWSATDNADELGFRFYAVVGRLEQRPETRLRLGVYGYFLPLPVTALFAGPAGLRDLFPTARGRDEARPATVAAT